MRDFTVCVSECSERGEGKLSLGNGAGEEM